MSLAYSDTSELSLSFLGGNPIDRLTESLRDRKISLGGVCASIR